MRAIESDSAAPPGCSVYFPNVVVVVVVVVYLFLRLEEPLEE